ncbi:ras gtpase-activating protein [Anaeramoeba ignava]|uniref:Ras gtpase-activating protein n=1 Tax=Anaeramoeba ignava TaxID=1746090 RepID=A0A9Q0L8K3_ANAIG|nr:ras gtpase-activating protein [Anaeramoeba ignava]
MSFGIALETFRGDRPGQLNFSVGDIIFNVQQTGIGKLTGTLENGNTGTFPSYCVKFPIEPEKKLIARAIEPYASRREGTLSFFENDLIVLSDQFQPDQKWLLGTTNNSTGKFPSYSVVLEKAWVIGKKAFSKNLIRKYIHSEKDTHDELLVEILTEPKLRVLKELSFMDKRVINSVQLADCIVKLFDKTNKTNTLISFIVNSEIENAESENAIFRGNILSSKIAASIAKLYGHIYLKKIIEPCINEVKKENSIRDKYLKKYVSLFLEQILSSDDLFPRNLHWLCHELKSKLKDKYNDEHLFVIGSFLFTRFFSPSITNPEIFDLVSDEPKQSLSQILLLIAKVLQALANQSKFGALSSLFQFNGFIEENKSNFLEFLSHISDSSYQTKPTDSLPQVDYDDLVSELSELIELNKEIIQKIYNIVKEEITENRKK